MIHALGKCYVIYYYQLKYTHSSDYIIFEKRKRGFIKIWFPLKSIKMATLDNPMTTEKQILPKVTKHKSHDTIYADETIKLSLVY